MSSEFSPALSPAEWAGVLAQQEQLDGLRDGLLDTPFSSHGVAALMLFGQPFGFSAQDVEDETDVAAYCDRMAAEHRALGSEATAATFEMLGGRHRIRAAKIAALLPPKG